MSDEYTPPPTPATPPTVPGAIGATPNAGTVARPVLSAQEINEGKVMAILVYVIALIFPLFWLVPLIMRDNRFSLYHAKQGLMHFLVSAVGGAAAGVVTLLLGIVTLGFGFCLLPLVWIAWVLFHYGLLIIGIVNAANGEIKPLPIIGRWAESLFSGVDIKPQGA